MLYTRFLTASALLALAGMASAAGTAKQKAPEIPSLGSITTHGCYNSSGEMSLDATNQFNTDGICAQGCLAKGKPVAASYSKECWCGDKYPPKMTLVDDSQCTEPCPGFGEVACGGMTSDGVSTWTVYNTGLVARVADSDPSVVKPSSSASSSAAATSAAQATSSASASPSQSAPPSSGGGGNTVGIAVGVVVGVVVLLGIAGVVFFIFRRRRNAEIEDEHRRNAAVNAFINGGKAPSTAGSLSINDQRLDPVMANRRASSGSIDDNQDYSRRILRVSDKTEPTPPYTVQPLTSHS
jgi:cell wall integrity and stress response component